MGIGRKFLNAVLALTPGLLICGAVVAGGYSPAGYFPAGAQAISAVWTMTGANIITHAATSGLRILDTGADHRISINASSDEAADRALSIPALAGAGTLALSSHAQTFTGVQTLSSAPVLSTGTLTANGDTITIEDLGNANIVQSVGTQTIAGAKTFSTPPTITGGLTAANIQTGSAKRELLKWTFAQNIATQTAADSTVYSARLWPGRAGIVKQIIWGCKTAPTVGTDTLKVLKASSSGNTMLSTATVDANTLVADTGTAATLTATGADLAITALQPIYVEYNAGVQTVDAVDLSVTIEFEPTDF